MEVVVAQVVEQWDSLLAGRIRIPGWTLAFFSSESLRVRLLLITYNRTVLTLPSSFLFPIIIYHCENYQANNVPRKRKKKSKKRPGKAHI